MVIAVAPDAHGTPHWILRSIVHPFVDVKNPSIVSLCHCGACWITQLLMKSAEPVSIQLAITYSILGYSTIPAQGRRVVYTISAVCFIPFLLCEVQGTHGAIFGLTYLGQGGEG